MIDELVKFHNGLVSPEERELLSRQIEEFSNAKLQRNFVKKQLMNFLRDKTAED